MHNNGRPKLGYSNLYWVNIDREQRAQIFNREELIREVLSEAVAVDSEAEAVAVDIPINQLQLMKLNEFVTREETNDKTRSTQGINVDKRNQHSDVKNHRDAV
jgi:hypothetical protein